MKGRRHQIAKLVKGVRRRRLALYRIEKSEGFPNPGALDHHAAEDWDRSSRDHVRRVIRSPPEKGVGAQSLIPVAHGVYDLGRDFDGF
jgi:hypothetical protein